MRELRFGIRTLRDGAVDVADDQASVPRHDVDVGSLRLPSDPKYDLVLTVTQWHSYQLLRGWNERPLHAPARHRLNPWTRRQLIKWWRSFPCQVTTEDMGSRNAPLWG